MLVEIFPVYYEANISKQLTFQISELEWGRDPDSHTAGRTGQN